MNEVLRNGALRGVPCLAADKGAGQAGFIRLRAPIRGL